MFYKDEVVNEATQDNRMIRTSQWMNPPPECYVKVNCDGSKRQNHLMSTLGWIIYEGWSWFLFRWMTEQKSNKWWKFGDWNPSFINRNATYVDRRLSKGQYLKEIANKFMSYSIWTSKLWLNKHKTFWIKHSIFVLLFEK